MSSSRSRRHAVQWRGESLSETPDEVWESDDCVRRSVVIPTELAERLAAEAERRGLSVSDLLIEYADEGLRREREAD